MKPLTTEEIAEERENLRENGGDDAVGLPTNRLVRLLDEVERSRAMFKRIEWSANLGQNSYCCAACEREERQGHGPGCELAALLG